MTEAISPFNHMLEKFAHIQGKYGDNYPIVLYEPAIECQEKKILKNLVQENKSLHLFDKFKEAFKFVQSLSISFILIVPSDLDEQHVLKNFQTLGNAFGRTMFDFEEEALLKEIFQDLSAEIITSFKIKTFVFVTFLDFMIQAPVKKEEEEVMVMCDLKDMAKEFRQEFALIWYDPQICSTFKEVLKQKYDIEEKNIYDNFEELWKRIHNSEEPSFHLVLTGKNKAAEKILNEINHFKESSICLYIYCDDPSHIKIKNRKIFVEETVEKLLPKITEGIRTNSKLTNSFPAFTTAFDGLDRSHIYNLHYYLQGLINFENRGQAKNDFIKLAKAIYQSRKIFEFDQEYSAYNKNKILAWYAKESPVYKLVNNCLRIATSDSILYCRYLLRDLEVAIREKYQEESHAFNGHVFRGAFISQEEWEKLQRNVGKEIEMYGFLSTSQSLETAKSFLYSDLKNKILITIIVPPLPAPMLNEQGFANLSQDSGFQEAEILFNVRSKFRILEAGATKINDQGKECRHLVLLYGAHYLRKYMTMFQPVVNLELNLPSKVKCGLCGSARELFAFRQEETEVRCLDCLRRSSVPKDVPLLALDSKDQTGDTRIFKGQILRFTQAMSLPYYYGYRCHQCQADGKKKYYKWINLKKEEVLEQCSDCFEEKRRVEGHILVAETNPYVMWQEYQLEGESTDVDYQTEVSMLVKDKNQGRVYQDIQRFDLCMEYERRLAKKLKRIRWREEAKLKAFFSMAKANEGSANYKKAYEIYRKFLDVSKFRYEKESLTISYDCLANVCRNLGQNQEALQWYAKALSLTKDIYGDSHQQTASILNNTGLVYQELGQYQKAFEDLKKALDIRAVIFGDNHPETAISYNNYAIVLRSLGQFQEALEYHKKAVDIRRAVFGEKHPDTASSYCNYATSFHDLGKYKEALEYQKKALDIRKAILGDKHPHTALSYNSYASIFDSLGEYQKAFEYYKMSLNIRKAIFDEKHPDIVISYNNIAAAYRNLEKHQEALEYFTKALIINKEIFGENHPMTASLYSNCSVVYDCLGQIKEAFEFDKKALHIRETIFGVDHPTTAGSYQNIAFTCQKLGQYQEGLEYSKKAMNCFRSIYGEMHPNTAASYNVYAACCVRLEQYQEALDYLIKAITISKAVSGDKHPITIKYRNNYNAACQNMAQRQFRHF